MTQPSPFITGSGGSTNPQTVVWFCHLCMATFTLPAGYHHVCKPKGIVP